MSQQPGNSVAGQTMIVPLAHPVLRDITDECLLQFRRAREEYLRVMEDHKKAGSTAKPVSLKSSVQPSLLADLVELGEFEGLSDVSTLTDEGIKAWIDAQLKPEEDELVSLKEVATAVRRGVHMNTQIGIAKLRIKKLFLDYRRFMREHRWDHLIEKKPKESTSHICSILQPQALRTRVQTALECETEDINADWAKFFAYCLKEAVAIDKYVPLNSRSPSEAPSQHGRSPQRSPAEPSAEQQGGRRKKSRGGRKKESEDAPTDSTAYLPPVGCRNNH